MRGFPMSKRENKTCSYLLLANGMVPFQMVDLPNLLHDYGFNIMAQRMIGSLSQWKDDLLSCPGENTFLFDRYCSVVVDWHWHCKGKVEERARDNKTFLPWEQTPPNASVEKTQLEEKEEGCLWQASVWREAFFSFWDENENFNLGFRDENENQDQDNSCENFKESYFLLVSELIFWGHWWGCLSALQW